MGRSDALTGVIFDCDGTLVDSEPLSGEAWRRVMAPRGYEITDADLEACVGGTYPRTHAYMAERAPLPDLETVWAELSRELFALIDAHLEPFADALAAIEELRARGVRIAVASSSVRERLDRTLARAGLQFEITIAGDEVEHSEAGAGHVPARGGAAGAAARALRRRRGLRSGRRRGRRRRDADARRLPRPGDRGVARPGGPRRPRSDREAILALLL